MTDFLDNITENNINENFEVKYTVSYIIFQNDDFFILKIKSPSFLENTPIKNESPILKGHFNGDVKPGDTFKSVCAWVFDKNYGYELVSKLSVYIMPESNEGIKNFLVKNIRGIGKKTAEKLVNAYGGDTFSILRENPENIIKVVKMGKQRALDIVEQLEKFEEFENLAVFLFNNGIESYNDAVTIYNEFGSKAINLIKNNPYVICDKLSISKFPIADKIALNLGVSTDDETRLSNALYYYIYEYTFTTGNMFVYYDYLLNDINKFMYRKNILNIIFDEINIDKLVKILEKKNKIVNVLYYDTYIIYLNSMYNIELGTADAVCYLNNTKKDIVADINMIFDDYEKNTDIILDELQKQAVINALTNRFSILTGGPGTGKTQTVNALISCLSSLDSTTKIALVAPTGRAAKRISELTGKPAKTIHRYLNIMDNLYVNDENIKIDDDYIICDEASMIDAPLFYKLITAVCSSSASLVLIGDKNQLPPVSPGLPFKELVCCNEIPSVTLDTLHRQAAESQININAGKILKGETDLSFALEKQDFYIFNSKDADKIKTLLIKVINRLIELDIPLDEIMVLSPMKKGELGADEINNLIQSYLNPKDTIKAELKTAKAIFREGDKVMQIKNNYKIEGIIKSDDVSFNGLVVPGVFNGDIGVISEIDVFNKTLEIIYDDYMYNDNGPKKVEKKVVYGFEEAAELSLAYASTIHKSQGCEYKCVIILGHESLVNMNRSILYTGVTRAKERLFYIGDVDSLNKGIGNNVILKRNTILGTWVIDNITENK